MPRLRNGLMVIEDGGEKTVFAIKDGSPVQVDLPTEQLSALEPGYYDQTGVKVPDEEAVAEPDAPVPTKTSKAAPRTLYVQRRLLNGEAVQKWAASQGIKTTLPPEDMHVTVAFSRAEVDWSKLPPDPNGVTVLLPGQRALHQFPPRSTPNGALVLKFAAPALERRWSEFRAAGASWDFPEYQPHVTLTYSIAAADLSGIEPYRGPLAFGPEIFSEVNDGWANDIVEVPTGAAGQ